MQDEVRIGVFVCDCGSNIAGVVNVPEVVEYAKGLKNVVFADEGRWSCSVDYLESMKQLIKEHRLNRVVIAACTPRTHEPLFKRTVREAGLNPYLLEFVSIREQSSWVHMDDPSAATE
ncbi:MAG: heterodisulfide reductase, partial [Deltaproteobacteria bacterium]